jgi:hypothetical protein
MNSDSPKAGNGRADTEDVARRSFLLSGAGLLTSTWLAANWPAVRAAAHHADQMPLDTAPAHFEFFDPADGADVDAIAAQIVPSGATPGAREAHAVYFIDRTFATCFAAMAADYRAGLVDFQSKFKQGARVASFAAAGSDEQIAFLKTVDHTPFFETTRMLTVLGMFTSPKYGGNYRGAGWRLMGFVDQHAFSPPFGYYDREYTGFEPYAEKPA